jgi:hypothetical protein
MLFLKIWEKIIVINSILAWIRICNWIRNWIRIQIDWAKNAGSGSLSGFGLNQSGSTTLLHMTSFVEKMSPPYKIAWLLACVDAWPAWTWRPVCSPFLAPVCAQIVHKVLSCRLPVDPSGCIASILSTSCRSIRTHCWNINIILHYLY